MGALIARGRLRHLKRAQRSAATYLSPTRETEPPIHARSDGRPHHCERRGADRSDDLESLMLPSTCCRFLSQDFTAPSRQLTCFGGRCSNFSMEAILGQMV
jgi:hypothetical protein